LVRIRIRGSLPVTNGSGSCFFFIFDPQDASKINFFGLLRFERTFTSLLKDKKS
jgi:hypothetical protein